MLRSFDAVLLFGLTIIHSPSRAVEAYRQLVKPGGEPLGNIGLRGHMWSFTEDSIRELFAGWSEHEFEFFSNMFYVAARAS